MSQPKSQTAARSSRRKSAPPGGVNRRQMIERLLTGAGAGLALPATAAAAARIPTAMPMPAARAQAPVLIETEAGYLDAHQKATLEAISLRILPGTNAVETVAFIDKLLDVLPTNAAQYFATGNNDPQGTVSVPAPAKQNLLDALGAFEAVSRRRYGLPYKDLSEARQIAILNLAARPPQPAKPAVLPEGEAAAPAPATLHDHFLHLKNWIAGAYFSSEAGTRAMGWTGNVFFPSFPGCPHGGH